VVTADRRNAVPSRLHAAVANRLILRHAEDTSYTEHGIKLDTARQLDQIPGRGLIDGSTLVQVACPAVGDHSARAQNAAISELADRLGRPPTATLMTSPLRETISGLGTTEAELTVPLGVADVTGRVVEVDLAWSHLAVCGPTRSGRSTALATVVAALQAGADHELFVVGQASSPLAAVAGERSVFGRAEQMAPFLDRLANQVAMGPGECPRVLVVDDVDRLDDPSLAMIWERLASLDDLRIVMSLESRSMSGYTSSAMVNVARRARRLLVLQPDDPTEFLQLTGSKLSLRLGLRLPVGRGVLLVDRQPTTLQVALPHRGLTPR
jgi:S-DNA-T family DNA segregation ATPase FtsK/SpoIIIE